MAQVIQYASEYVWGSALDESVSPQICMDSLPFLQYNCLSVLVTKLIGVAIICGAALNKAPIFFNIYRTKSGAGFTMSSVYAESIMYSNAAFYGILRGNPLTSFGENLIVTVQTLGVVMILWRFKSDPKVSITQRMVAFIAYCIYVFYVFTLLKPDQYHYLHMCNWGALTYARGSQIVSTFQIQHTGNQSIITMTMNISGTIVRIFTTLKEVGWDFALMSGYLISAGLNSILILQYFYYRKNTALFLKKLNVKED